MAVEFKPRFPPEVMRQQIRAFTLPEQVQAWQPKLEAEVEQPVTLAPETAPAAVSVRKESADRP